MAKRNVILCMTTLTIIVMGCFVVQQVLGVNVTSPINMNSRSITNLSTLGGDSEAINGSYLRSSLDPIYNQLSSVLTSGQDYGRYNVASTLYKGTTALSDKYLGKTGKAADADKLDDYDSSYFQKRVSGYCWAGDIIRAIDSSGSVTCEEDDVGISTGQDWGRPNVSLKLYEGTTQIFLKYLQKNARAADADKLDGYDSGYFLTTTGKAADADKLDGGDSSYFQKRVSGTCAGSSAIRQIYSDGTVNCETLVATGEDYGRSGAASTLYEGTTALSDKYLGKTGKAANADKLDGYDSGYFQRRVSGYCSSDSAIRIIYSDGTVGCQTLAALWRESPLASNDTYYIGNVAIGKSQANYPLDIEGTLAVSGTKNFVIDHPIKENTKLIHSTLEGPEAAVFYRGEGQLVEGQAIVELPDYFEALTRKEGRTVLLTPKFESDEEPISNLTASPVKEGKFKVWATDAHNPNQKFFWEVKAVRADVPLLQVERNK